MKTNQYYESSYFKLQVIRQFVLQMPKEFVASLQAPTQKLLGIDTALEINSKPDTSLSLTDAQKPEEQLRFFQKERVYRFIRRLAHQIKNHFAEHKLNNTINLKLYSQYEISECELFFINELKNNIHICINRMQTEALMYNDINWQQTCVERLSVGDTWSALAILEAHELPIAESHRIKALSLALQGHTDRAEKYFDLWIYMATPVNKAWALYSKAMLYARHHTAENRSLDIAETYLEQAYSILCDCDANNEEVHFSKVFNRNGLGLILFRRGKLDEAIATMQTCISKIPTPKGSIILHKSVLIYNLAQCYVAKKDYALAQKSFLELLNYDPDYAENRVEYAKLLDLMGQTNEAQKQSMIAISLDPSLASAHNLMGQLLQEQNEKESYFQTAHELEMSNLQFAFDYLECLMNLQKWEKAAMIYNQIKNENITTASEYYENYIIYGAEILLAQKNTQQALNLLKLGVTENPHSVILKENLEIGLRYA